MVGRRADDSWDNEIFDLTEANPRWGPDRVVNQLQVLARDKGIDFSTIPSSRTVARKQVWFRGQPAGFRRQFSMFRWPDSFEAGDLPWEAVRPAMYLARRAWPDRVPVRMVYWFWRLLQSAPVPRPESRAEHVDVLRVRAMNLSMVVPGTAAAAEMKAEAEAVLMGGSGYNVTVLPDEFDLAMAEAMGVKIERQCQ